MVTRDHMLGEVRRAVEAVENRGADAARNGGPAVVATGWAEVDAALPGGGLRCDGIHEWFAADGADGPPRGVLTHLAWQAVSGRDRQRGRKGAAGEGWVVWIGRAVWPEGHGLVRGEDGALLERSIFLDAGGAEQRLWAADLATRCAAVRAVVADASGFDMAATRRLQLAAKAGGALVLLARPAREMAELSAAATRWRVEPALSSSSRPRWAIHALRCKGVQGAGGMGGENGEPRIVEWDRAQGVVDISAGLGDRATGTAKPAARRERLARRRRRRRSA